MIWGGLIFNLLKVLGEQIYTTAPSIEISKEEINKTLKNSIVVLPAGGEGTRIRALTDDLDINKVLLEIGGGSLIERTITLYRDVGIENFVLLVYFKAESVRKDLGDGSKLNVNITYSEDPGHPAGRGGAILNAYLNGTIQSDKILIIHNPDDVIINYPGNFPQDMIQTHLQGVKQGTIGTVVVVRGTPYVYSGLMVSKGLVTDISMYPFIPIPTHIGITVLEPASRQYFEEMIDLETKTDFESVILPRLASERKLYAFAIPNDSWIAVNDLKGVRTLMAAMERETL